MATAKQLPKHDQHEHYFIEVDDVEYGFDHEPVTGAEIMAEAGVPEDVGLLQILDDGTQKPVQPADTFELKPGQRFKKRPRFKRG